MYKPWCDVSQTRSMLVFTTVVLCVATKIHISLIYWSEHNTNEKESRDSNESKNQSPHRILMMCTEHLPTPCTCHVTSFVTLLVKNRKIVKRLFFIRFQQTCFKIIISRRQIYTQNPSVVGISKLSQIPKVGYGFMIHSGDNWKLISHKNAPSL